jgi:glycosyltransferase involved in cell wall biosynthesis
MRIAFDAKRMLNNPTGLGNHARILANALMRDHADNDYLFFSPSAKDEFLNQLHGNFEVHFPETKLAQAIHPWWRSYAITDDLLRNKVDIYHGISNELPFNIHRTRIKTVVTIHDLIFRKHKEQYPWIDRRIYTLKTKYAAKHADRIIAVSQETKQDLIKMYGVPERKIEVIYQSVNEKFYQKVSEEKSKAVSQQYKLPEKYILNVGSFFPRKNQIGLIEAFDLIKDRITEDLVLVGTSGYMLPHIQKMITEKNLDNRIHILTNASDGDLPSIYQSASAFVFPSLFEGFGVPVLEALFSGTPVIASRGGAIEEAAGKDSLFINPHSTEDMADKILSTLNDEGQRKKMIGPGYLHAQTMTDRVFAAKTMEVYKSIL